MTLAPAIDNPSLMAEWFSPDSFMNTRVESLRRADPASATVVGKLAGWVHGKPASIGASTLTPGKPWIDQVTVFNADYSRRQKVTLKVAWWLQQAQQPYLDAVPVPDAAVGNGGTDNSLVIVDEAAGRIWDFWQFTRNAQTGALGASAAGWIDDHPFKEGAFTSLSSPPESAVLMGGRWGVQASGFSQAAGLTTIQELIQGCIPHATAFHVPWARSAVFSAPAQRTDGTDTTASSIPYGARFTLDPAFDSDVYQAKRRTQGWDGVTPEPSFTLGRFARVVINAWKWFGAVPVDQTHSGVALLMESQGSAATRLGGLAARAYGPAPGYAKGPDYLWDAEPDVLMRQLPWEELQLMPLDLRRAI